MDNKPTLYIMCGLPFSGKSYTGKRIAELVKGQFFAYDEIWQEVNKKTGHDPSWEEMCKLA